MTRQQRRELKRLTERVKRNVARPGAGKVWFKDDFAWCGLCLQETIRQGHAPTCPMRVLDAD